MNNFIETKDMESLLTKMNTSINSLTDAEKNVLNVLLEIAKNAKNENRKSIELDDLHRLSASILWQSPEDIKLRLEEAFELPDDASIDDIANEIDSTVRWDDVVSDGIEAGNDIIDMAIYNYLKENDIKCN